MKKLKEVIQNECLKEFSRICGEIIQTMRHGNGLTQKDLADKLHLSQATISNYESGKKTIPLSVLMVLKIYLHIPENPSYTQQKETYDYLNSLPSLYLSVDSTSEYDELLKLIESFNAQHKTALIKSPWLSLANVQSYWIERLNDEEGNMMIEYVYLISILLLIAIIICETIKTIM